jgi:hypothetical protein
VETSVYHLMELKVLVYIRLKEGRKRLTCTHLGCRMSDLNDQFRIHFGRTRKVTPQNLLRTF